MLLLYFKCWRDSGLIFMAQYFFSSYIAFDGRHQIISSLHRGSLVSVMHGYIEIYVYACIFRCTYVCIINYAIPFIFRR